MARLAATELGADWVPTRMRTSSGGRRAQPQGCSRADPERYESSAERGGFRAVPGRGRLFAERITRACARPRSTITAEHALEVRASRRRRRRGSVAGSRGVRRPAPAVARLVSVRAPALPVARVSSACGVRHAVRGPRADAKGIPNHMARAHEAWQAGRLEQFYDAGRRRRRARARAREPALDLRHPLRDCCGPRIRRHERWLRTPHREHPPSATSTRSPPPAMPPSRRRSRSPTSHSCSARGSTGSSAASACSSEALSPASVVRCTGSPAVTRAWRRLEELVRHVALPPSCSWSRSACSGSRHSAGRWRRDATVGLPRLLPQLLDSSPPLSELQVFRTPSHAHRRGCAARPRGCLGYGGGVRAALRGPRSSPGADRADVRRIPALFAAGSCLGYPAYATSTTRPRATASSRRASRFRPRAGRTLEHSTGDVRPARRRDGGPRARSDRRTGVPGGRARAAHRVRPVAHPAHVVGRCLLAALVPLAGWAVAKRCSLRRHDGRARRERLGPVPPRLPRRRDYLSRERRRLARAGRSHRAGVLPKPPFADLDVPLDVYLTNGSNYETVRLIALSDRVFGRGTDYEVMFESATEAIRGHPGTYVRRRCRCVLDFLNEKPLREDVGGERRPSPRRRRRPSSRTASTSDPQTTCSWTASRTASSGAHPIHPLLHARPTVARLEQPRAAAALRGDRQAVRAWDAEPPTRNGGDLVPEL